MVLLHQVGGELDIVDAVTTVEDHRIDGGPVGDAERIGRVLRPRHIGEAGRAEQPTHDAAEAVVPLQERAAV